MRFEITKIVVLAVAMAVSRALLATEPSCGTGDNAPCPPVFPVCAGAFCNDSVYTSPDPDASTSASGDQGELSLQVWAVRELPQGADGGACNAARNWGSPDPVRVNKFKHVGEKMGSPSFVMQCGIFGCGSQTSWGRIANIPAGKYQVEYCVVINNDGSDNIKLVRPVVQVTSPSGAVTSHVGKTYSLQLDEGNQQVCDTAVVDVPEGGDVGVRYYKGGTNDANHSRCRGKAANMTGEPEVYDSVRLYKLTAAAATP